MSSSIKLNVALLALGVGLLVILARRRKNVKYPPGPRGVPILGNFFDIPPADEYKAAHESGKKYGMSSSRVFGNRGHAS